MSRRLLAITCLAAAVATGCAEGTDELHGEIPYCDNWAPLVLAAQSVPTTQLVPCLDPLPLGWTFGGARIDSNGTRITLDSDRGGVSAVVVTLQETCDLTDTIPVPADEPDTDQFEYVKEVTGGFEGQRHYIFGGGCTTYEFDFDEEASAALVTESSAALTFVTRERVDQEVRDATDGRLGLDPE